MSLPAAVFSSAQLRNVAFWRRPWGGSFRLFERLSVQRFVKALRPRGELVRLPAAAVSTA